MAWTAPRTYVTGELMTSTMLNLHIRDQFNVFAPTYLFAVANTQNQLSVSPANWVGYSMSNPPLLATPAAASWGIGGNFGSVTVPSAGKYLVSASGGWDGGPWIRVSCGGSVSHEWHGARVSNQGHTAGIFYLNASDTISWAMFSAATNVSTAIDTTVTRIAIVRLLSD